MDLHNYFSSLYPKELIYWIDYLEEYLEYENTFDLETMRFVREKLKFHAIINFFYLKLSLL